MAILANLTETLRALFPSFALAGCVSAVLIAVWYYWGTRPIRFHTSIWKRSPDQRFRMIDDLLNHYCLEEMPRSQIEAILGEPRGRDARLYDRNIYRIGPGRLDDQLEIFFEDKKVVEVIRRSAADSE